MTTGRVNPRDIAVRALGDRGGNVSAHLDRLVAGASLSAADKALARELALGVVRRRGTIEAVLEAFLSRRGKRPPGAVTGILHVALYQMIFLDRVPDFAAVNEAVTQTRTFRHGRQSGLVNGLLRAVGRELGPVVNSPGPPAGEVIPIGPNAHRRMARHVFPDPEADPSGYLAGAFSLPRSLAARWVQRLGGLEQAILPAMHANVRAPLIARVNRLKADVPAVLSALAGRADPHADGRSVVLRPHVDVRELEAFRAGLIQPQDSTASAVVPAAGIEPGMKVLDFCAAPGTKTTQLAEAMENRGRILALDVSLDKLRRVTDNCRRMGVSIVTTMPAEQIGSIEPASFDLALVDAPCSNTGVLSRRPEARWRFDARHLASMARDQAALLSTAAKFVRSGGKCVYSTCSIEPAECGQFARAPARRHDRLALVGEELVLPGGAEEPTAWHDGGYVAIFSVK